MWVAASVLSKPHDAHVAILTPPSVVRFAYKCWRTFSLVCALKSLYFCSLFFLPLAVGFQFVLNVGIVLLLLVVVAAVILLLADHAHHPDPAHRFGGGRGGGRLLHLPHN